MNMSNSFYAQQNKIIYKNAVIVFGQSHQIAKAIEELSELIKELSRYLNDENNKHQIIDEIADAYIMLYQVRDIFGCKRVDAQIVEKTLRLKKRIMEKKGIPVKHHAETE